MPNCSVLLDGQPSESELFTESFAIEVEENLEMPSAVRMTVPVVRSETGDLTAVGEKRFKPFANIAVVAGVDDGSSQCIFDGVVLSHRLHLETGAAASTLEVWGEDSSWLMNLEEKVKEWTDVTDSSVAASIFGDYDITPASGNSEDDSPSHVESHHTLMQRGSDIQFLRMLARRNGKLCWVACKERPGERIGYFVKPPLDDTPAATLSLAGPENGNVDALDFEWEAGRPSTVNAREAVLDDDSEDGVGGETTDSGLTALGDRDLATFAGKEMKVLLAAPVDDAGELTSRAQSLLREAGWFLTCRGDADAARLKAVLRCGTVVKIEAAGSMYSGSYFVRSVRHVITAATHRMHFQLVRNGIGEASFEGGAF